VTFFHSFSFAIAIAIILTQATVIITWRRASKGTPGDAKCVREILREDKNKEVIGEICRFVSMENK